MLVVNDQLMDKMMELMIWDSGGEISVVMMLAMTMVIMTTMVILMVMIVGWWCR